MHRLPLNSAKWRLAENFSRQVMARADSGTLHYGADGW
jgi:hypothetical protein